MLKCIKMIYIFLFFKNYFRDQHIKTIQIIQKNIKLFLKKNLNFLGIRFTPRSHIAS
jgi:hypothetical protein